MTSTSLRVCPVELSGGLDNRLRRWLQNPDKILGPYVFAGMTALEVGCGPGFFTPTLAALVGPAGRIIACDLQEGMLQKLEAKIAGSELAARITLHNCQADRLGVTDPIDFALLFYMLHEVPDQKRLLTEVAALLTPGGRLLLVEPPFHVSKTAFTSSLELAEAAGLRVISRPRITFSKAALLGR